MRVLLTGSTGFIGRAILPFLKKDPKIELYTLSRTRSEERKNHYCLDILNTIEVKTLLELS